LIVGAAAAVGSEAAASSQSENGAAPLAWLLEAIRERDAIENEAAADASEAILGTLGTLETPERRPWLLSTCNGRATVAR